jgi:hypothetical protein
MGAYTRGRPFWSRLALGRVDFAAFSAPNGITPTWHTGNTRPLGASRSLWRDPVPQQNYRQARKQREQARKARQQEKQLKRAARQVPAAEVESGPQAGAPDLTGGEGT